jgi:hypothetical protein
MHFDAPLRFHSQYDYHRFRKLNSLLKKINYRLTGHEPTPKDIWRALGVTDGMFKRMEEGEQRHEVMPKFVNDFVDVFTDYEYMNHYNIENVMRGRVLAFRGQNPKERLMKALYEAACEHIVSQ